MEATEALDPRKLSAGHVGEWHLPVEYATRLKTWVNQRVAATGSGTRQPPQQRRRLEGGTITSRR
jgi:hypothetical protein